MTVPGKGMAVWLDLSGVRRAGLGLGRWVAGHRAHPAAWQLLSCQVSSKGGKLSCKGARPCMRPYSPVCSSKSPVQDTKAAQKCMTNLSISANSQTAATLRRTSSEEVAVSAAGGCQPGFSQAHTAPFEAYLISECSREFGPI